MLKKVIFAGILMFGAGRAWAVFPPVQERGATTISTMVAITVSTTPAILLSTGSNMVFDSGSPQIIIISSTTQRLGQFLPGRVLLEVQNASTHPVWIGYSANVTTFPSVNMGYRINASSVTNNTIQSWQVRGAVPNYWIASDDLITLPQVLVIQHK